MKAVFLCKSGQERAHLWREHFGRAAPEIEFRIWPDVGDTGSIRYLVLWEPIDDIATEFPNLEVLFSTGAGVDQFDLTKIPDDVRVVRLLDPMIIAGMREYVCHAVLTLHRDFLGYRQSQAVADWRPVETRPANETRVGVMGLGTLGRAVLDALQPFAYSLRAWSQSPHDVDGVQCFSGSEQLQSFVSDCDILICLLPLTAATRGILNRDLFDAMPRGSGLINVGRGAHLVEDALLAALSDGQISGAVLDVAGDEPLAPEHPFWRHPRIQLTPHIASVTGTESAAAVLLDNVLRHERGERMLGVIDRGLGY